MELDVHDYNTGEYITTITMTQEQFRRYLHDAERDTGAILACELPVSVGCDGSRSVYLQD